MMNILLQLLVTKLGGGMLEKLASSFGLNPGMLTKVLAVALPLMLSAMRKNVGRKGAVSLDRTLSRKHDGGILDNLGDAITGDNRRAAVANDGRGILGHLFGFERNRVERQISGASGVDLSTVTKLLPILAPLVMGALGKLKTDRSLDADALGKMFTDNDAPEVKDLGMFEKMLDRDNDGNIADDLMGIGTRMLGGLFS